MIAVLISLYIRGEEKIMKNVEDLQLGRRVTLDLALNFSLIYFQGYFNVKFVIVNDNLPTWSVDFCSYLKAIIFKPI